ncbi:hypothetical protein ACTFIZ_006143 [Dictyostelium cf. discoideum]
MDIIRYHSTASNVGHQENFLSMPSTGVGDDALNRAKLFEINQSCFRLYLMKIAELKPIYRKFLIFISNFQRNIFNIDSSKHSNYTDSDCQHNNYIDKSQLEERPIADRLFQIQSFLHPSIDDEK